MSYVNNLVKDIYLNKTYVNVTEFQQNICLIADKLFHAY